MLVSNINVFIMQPLTGGPPGMFAEDLMEVEGLEPGEIAPTRYFGPAVEWPKVSTKLDIIEHDFFFYIVP